MTVYTSEKSYHECMNDEEAWTVRHKGEYESSFHALVELKLEPPLRVLSGEKAGLYVHSTRQDDQVPAGRYSHTLRLTLCTAL